MILELAAPEKEESICIAAVLVEVLTLAMIDPF